MLNCVGDQMIAIEKHYTAPELGKLWGFSADTIRALFKDEPGVIKYGSSKYVSLRIPASVAARVHERLQRPIVRVKLRPPGPLKQVKLRELLAEKGIVLPRRAVQ